MKRYYTVGYTEAYNDNYDSIFNKEHDDGTIRSENGALYQHCNCCLGPDCNMGNFELSLKDENRDITIPENVQ